MQSLAECFEQCPVDRIALRIVFGVPLHGEREGRRIGDTDRLDGAILGHALDNDTLAGFEDALKVQAGVVGNIEGSRDAMDRIVGSSQSASGALQAAQAGNQLLALQARQLADLTAVVAAQGRAQALEASQRAAAQDQAREQLRRFLAPGTGYRPTPAQMFHR